MEEVRGEGDEVMAGRVPLRLNTRWAVEIDDETKG
jgi:hypothetical protein